MDYLADKNGLYASRFIDSCYGFYVFDKNGFQMFIAAGGRHLSEELWMTRDDAH